MKNLYPKSKGKIHPSPSPPSAFIGGGDDALAVLKLLPVAIFALTAALAEEDREVVAYLMIRSIDGPGPAAEERRRCGRCGGGAHQPLFDCGCFDCYTSFWSRWDCSRDRETIHMVIEAFEEHLASKEKTKGKESKRKRKKREKVTERASNEKAVVEAVPAAESKGFVEEPAVVSDECFATEREEDEINERESDEAVAESPAGSGERRSGWADVVGMFNSRLWSLWGPGA